MKNKSSYHKSTNRFKFSSFADRISAIDVRHTAIYHLDHANSDSPAENETHFYKAIQKWKVLNLTTEYVSFSKKFEKIVTLPQLLHSKDEVVNALIEYLESGTVLTLQPLLEIIVVLAKDLQEDFYVYFQRFLTTLINLLNTKEPEQLEWTLVCLAFLFKALRVYLKRDILIIFDAVLPLLSESMPEYVNNFAAESFAFVAREIKDKKKFLHVLVKTVNTKKDGIIGCGRLLFEVVRGVGNQFHSCAASFLSFLFESLNDKSFNRSTLFEILTQTVADMLQVIYPKNGEVFWNTILSSTTFYLNCATGTEDCRTLEYMLKLVGQAMEYGNGSFVTNPFPILVLIIQLLDGSFPENILNVTSEIGVLVLLSKHTNIPHEDAVSIVKKVLQIPHPLIVIKFVQEVITCSSFDIIVLPHFIRCIETFDQNIIRVLSKICFTKSPLCKSGMDLYSWVKYPIDFESKADIYSQKLLDAIDEDFSIVLTSPDDGICSLICLPHIKNLDLTKAQVVLEKLLSNLILHIEEINSRIVDGKMSAEDSKALRNALFILSITIESAVHTVDIGKFEALCSQINLMNALLPHACSPDFICALRILDLYLTVRNRQCNLEFALLHKLNMLMDKNLTSPFHDIRLLTTHLYSLFEEQFQKGQLIKQEHKPNAKSLILEKENTNQESFETLSLCYSVENLPLSVTDYREQLVNLSRMTHGSAQFQLSANTPFENFSLKYALGFLHVNFNLVWDPLKLFILSHANGMPNNKFWEVFYPCLIQATSHVQEGIQIPEAAVGFLGTLDFLVSAYGEYYSIEDKPDFSQYRIHLWEILYGAPAISEVKNRDLTNLFLDFLKIEFERSQQVNLFIEDSSVMEVETVRDSDLMETDDTEEIMKADQDNTRTVNKFTYDTLIAYLKVYSNIQNPKAMYMEKTLWQIYLDFLMHKNPVIQKIALDCVVRYKNKHLTPYKENLYNLIHGKKFKDELRSFKLQVDEGGIREDDREEVIPIILRITFSKMITNTGIDKKGGSQLRRSLVMRFLSGCEESELISYTNMAFQIFEPYMNLETEEIPAKILETLQEVATLPPKRILGALQLVDTMREQFIRPGQELLMLRLLKIVLCVGYVVNGILSQQQKLKPGYSKILKDIRNRCIQSVGRFFQQFEKYQWCFEKDILPIYDVFVWPIVEKLPTEGIYSPTPLLKLFNVWSQNPQYHPLFNVCKDSCHQFSPLPFYLQLLSSKKIHYTVNEMSMQILERLVTLEADEDAVLIEVSDAHNIPLQQDQIAKLNLRDKLNYGSSVLIPHISTIVNILKDKFGSMNPKKLQKRELIIISRVTEMVYQSEVVDTLLQFSLPILINRVGQNAEEDTLEASITALTSLLSKAEHPKQYVRLITPLFSKVMQAASRRALCKVLQLLGEKDDATRLTASIVSDMNAPDEKWIEQPDFEKRISAYKIVYQLSEEGRIDVELGALIVHNCFYIVRYCTDLSLRNTSIACLQKLVPKLVHQYKDSIDKDYLLRDTVLLLIRNSLKIDNELLKMEGISLLGELVRECTEAHTSFKELLPLSNKTNKEIDFFENLQHLQYHRKIRALQRFCTQIKESQNVPGYKTLTQFIIPVASQFICSEKYVPKYALVDAAIETIGVVCHLLPWRQYEAVLKFYVGKLQQASDYQKQLIKLVSVILDAFHFDLSRADNTELSAVIEAQTTNKKSINESTKNKDEQLDVPIEEDAEDVLEEVADHHLGVLPYDRMYTLSPSTAKRVIATITEILVQLNWSSSQIMEHESSHKTMRKGASSRREAEEKLKLPMALAVVKLLQKLPQPMLKNNILSVLMKVSNFLKSPMIGVRSTAREIISKIMFAVGTAYLGTLLNHLTTLLTRGIHVHVLISTVHTVLITLKDGFSPGVMDKHLQNVLKVCLNDLFGKASEEKEVVKLGHKAPEAKPSMKSFSTLRIIAQNISESSLTNLVKPFKDIAETSHSKRIILKVQSALQNISIGLGDNKNTSVTSLLTFLIGVLSGSINKLNYGEKKIKIMDDPNERYKLLKPNCLLITPSTRGKKGVSTKVIRTNAQANVHVLTEFALNLLFATLQKDNVSDEEYRPIIDSSVPFLVEALKSSQVKVSTLALKCVTSLWSKRYDLPAMKTNIAAISSAIFHILHKYATSGLSKKDDNFHLVANAFKAVTALIREVKYHTISADEMKALLLYAEHDIDDAERQATAFSLVKTIINAKYRIPEIHVIMKKVADISILSENPRTREEARIVMLVFIMNYPLQKKLTQHIQFYLIQLGYELDHGRISAIKMMQSIIEKFTVESLCEHAPMIYVSMGGRLVNDPSTDCRILIAECLELLIQRITAAKRNELFKINITLLKHPKPAHVEMAAQLCSRFVNTEKQNFKIRLEALLPELSAQLYEEDPNAGRGVRIKAPDTDNSSDESRDNSFIQILNLLNKVCEVYPSMLTETKYMKFMDEIAINCQNLLGHSHSWVRYNAAVFLVSFLGSLKLEDFALIVKGEKEAERLIFHTVDSLKSLTLDLCSQFIPGVVTTDMADVVCKNMAILFKIVSTLSEDQNANHEDNDYIHKYWVVSKLKSAINSEVTKAPGSTIVRMSIFKMLEELLDNLDKETVFSIAKMLMPCVVREMTKTDASFENLKNQADVVGLKISQCLGDVVYNDLIARITVKLSAKRKERKQKIAQDKLVNPEKAAKRKLTIKEKKKDYKRKKVDILKGRMPNSRIKSKMESMDVD